MQAEPGNATCESNRRYVLLQSGRPDQALAHCKDAVRLEPSLSDAHFSLGNVLAALGRKAEARAEFALAVAGNAAHTGAARRFSRGTKNKRNDRARNA
jgi:tetratricopeptide (TPR) repeat protein